MRKLFIPLGISLFSLFVSCDPPGCPEVMCRSVEETIGSDRKLDIRVTAGNGVGFADRGIVRVYPMYDNTTDMVIMSYNNTDNPDFALFLAKDIKIGGSVGNGTIYYDRVASSMTFRGKEYHDVDMTIEGAVMRREKTSDVSGRCPGVNETYVMELDIRFVVPEYVREEGEPVITDMEVRMVAKDMY